MNGSQDRISRGLEINELYFSFVKGTTVMVNARNGGTARNGCQHGTQEVDSFESI